MKILKALLSAVFVGIVLFLLQNALAQRELEPTLHIHAGDGTEKLRVWQNDQGDYYAFVPGYAQMKDVTLMLNTEAEVTVQGVTWQDGMTCETLETGKTYTMEYRAWGAVRKKQITFIRSAGLPTMYVDTSSGSMEFVHLKKGNKEDGRLRLYAPDGELLYAGKMISISGRGNYTWEAFEKKPYSLCLAEEADLLGMGAAQNWILLANAADPSHMRNKLVYDFAAQAGLPYSPQVEWVELYLDGDYAGLYMLSERNEIHPERINISDETGYVVSAEGKLRLQKQNYLFVETPSGRALRIHCPETETTPLTEGLKEIWACVERAIAAPDGIDPESGRPMTELIDLDSWARKYLMEEIFANVDGGYISQYFYGELDKGPVYAGPVWDFDLALGTESEWQLRSPRALYANWVTRGVAGELLWFHSLYENETFYARVKEIYETEFRPLLLELLQEGLIRTYAKTVASAAKLDRVRWPGNLQSYEAAYQQVEAFLSERIQFLDELWIEEKIFYTVCAFGGEHTSYAYYAVAPGECLELPEMESTEERTFLGWYYEEDGQRYDAKRPVTEDVMVYAAWQEHTGKRMEQIVLLLPAAVIAGAFLLLLCRLVKRIRENG